MDHVLFPGREIRLKYYNTDPRVVDAERMRVERQLKRLGTVTIEPVPDLDSLSGAALVIVGAATVPSEKFAEWFRGFRRRILRQGNIWMPALIISDVSSEEVTGMMDEIIRDNWYFDIVAPAHAESLAMRVANLIRIHDHLHELKRYESALSGIQSRIEALEAEMKTLKARP